VGSFKLKLVVYFLLLSLLPIAAAFWGFTQVAGQSETRRVDARLQSGLRSALSSYQQRLDAAQQEANALKEASLVYVRAPQQASNDHTNGSAEDNTPALQLKEGTRIEARLETQISSDIHAPVVAVVENTYAIGDQVLVPAGAPQMSAKGSFVYVVKQDSTAEQRPVSLGQRQGDLVVIEKGIEPGERVVTNGQLGVTPGGKVRIEQLPAAGNPVGATGQ